MYLFIYLDVGKSVQSLLIIRLDCGWVTKTTHVRSAEIGLESKRKMERIEKELSNDPPPPPCCLAALSPLYRNKWECMNPAIVTVCFTCCTVTPKNSKLLSNSCSSLNYLTHYYIIPNGRAPDSCWLPANLFSVFLHFCLSFCHSTEHYSFSYNFFCILLPDRRHFCPIAADSLSVLLARLTGYLLFMPLLTLCVPTERQMDVCNTRFSAEWWIVCLSK